MKRSRRPKRVGDVSTTDCQRVLQTERRTILYGQTPLGVRRKELVDMAEASGVTISEFAQQVVKASTKERLQLLRDYYTPRLPPQVLQLFDELKMCHSSHSQTDPDVGQTACYERTGEPGKSDKPSVRGAQKGDCNVRSGWNTIGDNQRKERNRNSKANAKNKEELALIGPPVNIIKTKATEEGHGDLSCVASLGIELASSISKTAVPKNDCGTKERVQNDPPPSSSADISTDNDIRCSESESPHGKDTLQSSTDNVNEVAPACTSQRCDSSNTWPTNVSPGIYEGSFELANNTSLSDYNATIIDILFDGSSSPADQEKTGDTLKVQPQEHPHSRNRCDNQEGQHASTAFQRLRRTDQCKNGHSYNTQPVDHNQVLDNILFEERSAEACVYQDKRKTSLVRASQPPSDNNETLSLLFDSPPNLS